MSAFANAIERRMFVTHTNDVTFFNHFVFSCFCFCFLAADAEQSTMNATDVRVIVPLNLLHRSGTWSSPQNLSSSYNHLARSAYTRFDWCGWRVACGLVVLCCIFAFVWWMSSSSSSLLMEWDRFIGVSTCLCLCQCPCDCACMARILFSLGLIIIINNNNIDRIRTHIRIRKIQKTVKTKTVWRQTHNEIYIYTISYVYLLFSAPSDGAAATVATAAAAAAAAHHELKSDWRARYRQL